MFISAMNNSKKEAEKIVFFYLLVPFLCLLCAVYGMVQPRGVLLLYALCIYGSAHWRRSPIFIVSYISGAESRGVWHAAFSILELQR